jgi:hypothetical protein
MKKTNKENPVTFFRKANEARQAKVKKSLPKAQDGKNVISFEAWKDANTNRAKSTPMMDRIYNTSPTEQMENVTKRMNEAERNKVDQSGAMQAKLTGSKKGGSVKRKK